MEKPKSELAKAIISVMDSVQNVDKNLDVGVGNNSYKGVSDKDVKLAVRKAMQDNGLAIIPLNIDAKHDISKWEEKDRYNNIKLKQSVFTSVITTYKLLHVSGEYEIISGYGYGVDSQDKGAGKATTYALKYALINLFLIPTGAIDDPDNTHSDNLEIPPTKNTQNPKSLPKAQTTPDKPWLNPNTPHWTQAINKLKDGSYTIDELMKKVKISKANQQLLIIEANK